MIARSWDSFTADCVCTLAGFCEIVLKVQEGRNVGRLKLDYLHGGRSFPFFGRNWRRSSDLGREQPGCSASVSFRPESPEF